MQHLKVDPVFKIIQQFSIHSSLDCLFDKYNCRLIDWLIDWLIENWYFKIPADPYEAELLALAGDIAAQDKDSSDSNSDGNSFILADIYLLDLLLSIIYQTSEFGVLIDYTFTQIFIIFPKKSSLFPCSANKSLKQNSNFWGSKNDIQC